MWIYVAMLGLINKLDWPIAKQIKLDGKVKLRMMGGERVESKVSPARWRRNR